MTSQKSSESIGVAVDRWKVGLIRLIIQVQDMSIPQKLCLHNLDAARPETSVWIGRLGPTWMNVTFVRQNHTFITWRSPLYNGFPPSAFHLRKLFILRGDVMHGYRRNNCPEEVLSVHRRTRMGGIYPHRCRGEIQAGVYRNVWSLKGDGVFR